MKGGGWLGSWSRGCRRYRSRPGHIASLMMHVLIGDHIVIGSKGPEQK